MPDEPQARAGLRLRQRGAGRLDAGRRTPQAAGHGRGNSWWPGSRRAWSSTTSRFFYNVLYSGVKSLRIDVPAEVADGSARHHARLPREDDRPAARRPRQGRRGLEPDRRVGADGRRQASKLHWEKPIEKLDIGKPVPISVPYLKPRDVDRAWGQIALVKSETIDVQESGEPKIAAAHRPATRSDKPRARRPPGPSSSTTTGRSLSSPRDTNWRRSSGAASSGRWCGWSSRRPTRSRCRRCTACAAPGSAWRSNCPRTPSFDAQPLRINGRAGAVGEGRAGQVLRAAGRPPTPTRRSCSNFATRSPGDGSQLDLPAFPEGDRPSSRRISPCICPKPGRFWAYAGRGPRSFSGGRDSWLAVAAAADGDPDRLVGWVREEGRFSAVSRRRLPNRRTALSLFHAAPGQPGRQARSK